MKILIHIVSLIFVLSLHAQQRDFDHIDFARADRIASEHKGAALTNLPVLTHQLTAHLHTDAERFRAIYYWVSHNIKGDYDMMHTNNRQREKLRNTPEKLSQWNTTFSKEVFTKLVYEKKTLCTGYAYVIQKMARLLGLECEIINGYDLTDFVKSDNPEAINHSWNAIKLNDKWYLCDATWSSGYTDMSSFLFVFDYDDSYFLMDPALFAKSHKPLDEQWALHVQPAICVIE